MHRVLEVVNLSVRFRTEDGFVYAVDDVSFGLESGEVLAIVGESGCGKTVTALSLVGLLPPSATVSGHVWLDGEDLTRMSPSRLRGIRGKRLGTAIVLITHDLGVVADVADRVMVMYAGRKVEEASATDLFAEPQHSYTLGLLGAVPNPNRPSASGRLQEIPGIVPSLDVSSTTARSRHAALAPTTAPAASGPSSRRSARSIWWPASIPVVTART